MTKTAKRAGRVRETPRALGYRMPAEWDPHEAIWLSWPHDTDSFPELERVEAAYAELVRVLHADEEIRLFVTCEAMRRRVEGLLKGARIALDRVRFYEASYADVWFRDYGPIYVRHSEKRSLAMTHWIFNAWGEKYDTLMPDTRLPELILEKHPMPCFRPGIVLEGGSIEVNGKGTLITTEQCLLNKNRNPGLDRPSIERYLGEYLGVDRVIWLGEGVAGDDTDGHVDDIARFVSEDTVVCVREEDPSDPNHGVLEDNWKRLRAVRGPDGLPLNLVELPMPGPVLRKDGSRLPASYANFYIGNRTVAVPVFGHPSDERALETLRSLFPGRRVRGIDCRDVVHGLGTLHCVSQQHPAV